MNGSMEESPSYPSPPPSASAPSNIQDHQTPIQAHYSNIPKIKRRGKTFQIPNAPSGSAASGSSGSSSVTDVTDAASESVANLTQYSNTDSDDPEKQTWIRQFKRRTKSNYEARVKEANYRRELEYIEEKERNDRLKAEYTSTQDKIKRLKAYYLKCLSTGKLKKCPAPKKQSPASAPLVTVKSEIVLDENVLVKEEQKEPDPHLAS